jgi:N-acetylglucosaminyldiphosphoundecaprenol N-acetyl-beta-D-mannosaminyltransferase
MAERLHILGVPVDALASMEACALGVEALMAAEHTACHSIFAVNPEKVMAARRRPELQAALERASLLIPDGIGVVLAARHIGFRHMRRVPGVELMEVLSARAAARGWAVFLLGATPSVNEKAAVELIRRYPGLRIAGRRDGYFRDSDDAAIVAEINTTGADLVFVALGSPKQELWIDRHQPMLRARICQGVGGSFDVLAGQVRRAPAVFRKLNLEWLYRLLSRPQRLLRQTALARFAWAVLRNGSGRLNTPHL